ncbi:MAG: insulinase family protein [Gammaproteobacteria bacterium]|nr:insulinase family protein [Gammaproteobacteria bacterium]
MGVISKFSGVFLSSLFFIGALQQTAIASPEIQSWATLNGARVLFVTAPDLPMVDVRVVFDAGSARDGDTPGLADMTNSLLNDGAGSWDANQIAQRLEEVGAQLGVGSKRDMAWASIRTLTEERAFERSVSTLAAILAQPSFESDDLERGRKSMLTALSLGEQKPGTIAKKAFYRAIFGDHPYATPSGGTKRSVAAITRDQVIGFHQRYYVARNAVISIVGAVGRAEAEKLAERLTAGLAAGEPAAVLPQVAALQQMQWESVQFPSSQSHILMGQPGMHRGDPDYFVLYVGNHILGGSGLVSQLNEEVREKRGLSYSVYSYFSPMRRNGPFLVGAQTQNSKAQEAVEVMLATLRRFIEKGPTQAELTAAKQNITGGFPLRVASNGNIVEYLSMIGFYGLPLDYLDAFVDRINGVTRDQIHEAFQRRLDLGRFVTVVVGNGKATQPEG